MYRYYCIYYFVKKVLFLINYLSDNIFTIYCIKTLLFHVFGKFSRKMLVPGCRQLFKFSYHEHNFIFSARPVRTFSGNSFRIFPVAGEFMPSEKGLMLYIFVFSGPKINTTQFLSKLTKNSTRNLTLEISDILKILFATIITLAFWA